MNLDKTLMNDMKKAMKNKDKETLTVIRMIRSALQNEAIKKNGPLNEEDETAVLSRELKQRKDSLQAFDKAGRHDLVKKLEFEMKVLETYLPKQLTNEELEQIIQETTAEAGATTKKDFGKVMSTVMPKVNGRADDKIVNQLVQKYLS